MIALNETDEGAAEVPFYLPTVSDPTVGLTGHTFTLGEVMIYLPGGTGWVNATLVKIREIGFGQYAVRLTSSQTTVAGTVYVRAVVSGAQNYLGNEIISDQGGDVAVMGDGTIPFYLPNVSDPIFGSPITGHAFTTGEVKVALPDASFADVDVSKIVEIGFGSYAYQLLNADGDTSTAGKAYLYANVSGAQRFLGYVTILGLSPAPAPTPTPPTPVTQVITTAPGGVSLVDHASEAVARLKALFRFPGID